MYDEKYSDLTRCCEGREFKLHKAIVCIKSPVLAAAVDGHFEVTFPSNITDKHY